MNHTMEYIISNNHLQVKIKAKGAELASVVDRKTSVEYMWSANPVFWAKSSPVLFPIVGTLKDNTYRHNDHEYRLTRHGFARDEMFSVAEKYDSSIVFLLASTETSLQKYPFAFELRIIYQLVDNTLTVRYHVKNTDDQDMLFSLGAHPAFAVPLKAELAYEDYFLEFESPETAARWPISKSGLIETEPQSFLQDENKIPLTRYLFLNDALVFKRLKSRQVSLRSDKDTHGIDFLFGEFPYLGIWGQPGANFVCIEPWCGIADSVDHDQELSRKEGVEKLSGNSQWTREWKARFY